MSHLEKEGVACAVAAAEPQALGPRLGAQDLDPLIHADKDRGSIISEMR